MRIQLQDQTYILAVSGGVDSMVLLDLVYHAVAHPEKSLVVAHFNHGIRADSDEDELLVRFRAEELGLRFESEKVNLGAGASEELARNLRYEFLFKLRDKYSAGAVLTAHHQDDLIETAAINILRGTRRLGLTSLRSRPGLERPLLSYRKADLVAYAKEHNLSWREDSTNQDPAYLRNRLRAIIEQKANDEWRTQFLAQLEKTADINAKLDAELSPIITRLTSRHGATISRSLIVRLEHDIAAEVIAGLLRKTGLHHINGLMIERVVVAAKTLRPGKQLDLDKNHHLIVTKRSIRIVKTATKKTVRV